MITMERLSPRILDGVGLPVDQSLNADQSP